MPPGTHGSPGGRQLPGGSACCAPHEPPFQARPWPASGPVWGGSQEDCPLWAVFGFRGPGGKWDLRCGTRFRPPAPFEGPWARRRRVAGLLSTKARARPGHGLHPASRAQILFSLLTVLWQTPGDRWQASVGVL